MSEFQYYEFYSVDRALTKKEMEEVDNLSTRFSPTPRRAVFTYSYSNFRHDVKTVLLKYFDFFLYLSNWGTIRVMYKFPSDLMEFDVIKRYRCNYESEYTDNGIEVYKQSNYVIIDINFSEEESDYWIEEESYLSSQLISLRQDILNRDYRVLFIMWLHIKSMEYELEQNDAQHVIPKQMIPENLGALSSNLESFINLYSIDSDWIKAIAKYQEGSSSRQINYLEAIRKLPLEKKEEYLIKLLEGETNLKIKLKIELDQEPLSKQLGTLKFEDLLETVKEVKTHRIKAENKQKEIARLKELDEIKKNEKVILREIDYHVQRGTGKSYDMATEKILLLKKLAIHQNKEYEFETWIDALKVKLVRKPAMLKRIEQIQ